MSIESIIEKVIAKYLIGSIVYAHWRFYCTAGYRFEVFIHCYSAHAVYIYISENVCFLCTSTAIVKNDIDAILGHHLGLSYTGTVEEN